MKLVRDVLFAPMVRTTGGVVLVLLGLLMVQLDLGPGAAQVLREPSTAFAGNLRAWASPRN